MQSLVLIIGTCVAVCAVAMILQIWTWIAFTIVASRMARVVRDRIPRMAAARETVAATFRENRAELRKVASSAQALAAITRRERAAVKEAGSDFERRYAAERERAAQVYRDVKQRAEKTAEAFESGVAEPWREVIEFLRGVEAGYTQVAPEIEEMRSHRPAA